MDRISKREQGEDERKFATVGHFYLGHCKHIIARYSKHFFYIHIGNILAEYLSTSGGHDREITIETNAINMIVSNGEINSDRLTTMTIFFSITNTRFT